MTRWRTVAMIQQRAPARIINRAEITPIDTRRATQARVTATTPLVNQTATRPCFEGFLKRHFLASLAVDWESSFAFYLFGLLRVAIP